MSIHTTVSFKAVGVLSCSCAGCGVDAFANALRTFAARTIDGFTRIAGTDAVATKRSGEAIVGRVANIGIQTCAFDACSALAGVVCIAREFSDASVVFTRETRDTSVIIVGAVERVNT